MTEEALLRPWLGSKPGTEPANKGKKLPGEPLTPDEANSLIAACSSVSVTGLRNRALITVMYRAGLRLDEALALKPADIDTARGTIRVLHGKGNRARTVGMDPGAMATVQRWMDARRAAGIRNGRTTLLCTLKGGKLSDKYVRLLLGRLAAKAGIDKRVHPHGLRHSHAFELMLEGTPVPVIQRQLGHAQLTTTAVYLDHLAPAQVITAMQRRTWTEPGR